MKNFHPTGNCPVRDVLSRLGDKWSMLVLTTLSVNGTMRFSDIHKTIDDISQRMLTVTLRTLEADGLVHRKVYPEVPPRVEYCLTELGTTLMPHIEALVNWAVGNMDEILTNRQTAGSKSPEGRRYSLIFAINSLTTVLSSGGPIISERSAMERYQRPNASSE